MKLALGIANLSHFALLTLFLACIGCASTTPSPVVYTPVQRHFPELEGPPDDPKAMVAVYDPLEPFNRTMYNFNARFDRYVFLPVVSAYKAVVPNVAEKAVTHFFDNLSEVKYLVNNLLQWEIRDSGVTVSRFVINTTVGVLGLWDPATKMGIYVRDEDFGQTLGRWGVGPGPFLVLPFFGPSSLRDTGGLAFDFAVNSEVDLLNVNDDPDKQEIRLTLGLVQAIDERNNTAFRYYETGTPFEYSLIRYTYLRLREVKIEK